MTREPIAQLTSRLEGIFRLLNKRFDGAPYGLFYNEVAELEINLVVRQLNDLYDQSSWIRKKKYIEMTNVHYEIEIFLS